jgi:hypothetical protein
MATIAAANFAKMPAIIRIKQQQYPAVLLAHRVKAMTPLFWAKVVIGVIVASAAKMEFNPSASTAP